MQLKYQGQLSNSEKLNINTKLEAINEKQKYIYYYGIKKVQYTIKTQGTLLFKT